MIFTLNLQEDFDMNLIQKRNLKLTIMALILISLMSWCGVRNSDDSVRHPDNQPYVLEVAFDLGVDVDKVTQLQFAKRYLK